MTHPFKAAKLYERREIFAHFGGNSQSGIVSNHPNYVVLVFDENKNNNIYINRYIGDGSYEFYAQGKSGASKFGSVNKSIRDHIDNNREILLFRSFSKNKKFRFDGEFFYNNFQIKSGVGADGARRSAIIFNIVPLALVKERIDADWADAVAPTGGETLDELRRAALAAVANKYEDGNPRTIYSRSSTVARYVFARAGGCCEGCREPAPFLRPNKTPYLEPHHLDRRSDGGLDKPINVIALCPTCHRRVHSGLDGQKYNETLKKSMPEIEPPCESK